MLEVLVICGMLIAVVALMEHNHHRTERLSRTPFALDLEVEGSADHRRAADELWALERAYDDDGVLAGVGGDQRAEAPARRPAPGARQARARWI